MMAVICTSTRTKLWFVVIIWRSIIGTRVSGCFLDLDYCRWSLGHRLCLACSILVAREALVSQLTDRAEHISDCRVSIYVTVQEAIHSRAGEWRRVALLDLHSSRILAPVRTADGRLDG